MEVEVKDDPRHPQRKIFLLYDMTALHDLRRLLNRRTEFEGMVGKAEVMQTVFEHVRALAPLDTTVLIEGETGTGKELVARAIHHTGLRNGQPFVPLNCAGLTESLLASQLFGHRRGAFTGAVEDRPGVFETAHGGTLFLDEIGDVSAGVQTSLLRVLEAKEIVRLGESTPRRVDVRIIAATHRDLSEEVRQGRFRSDLLYRIRVARISLPPLRERLTDIPLLAHSFIRDFRAASGKAVQDISSSAMGMLLDYAWPGNVRELGSAMEFACIRCRGPVIQCEDLPPEVLAREVGDVRSRRAAGGDERARLLAALHSSGGNRKAAARLMGISRATFYRRLQEMKIGS
jgi:DNA-binding NtrC family response regulator